MKQEISISVAQKNIREQILFRKKPVEEIKIFTYAGPNIFCGSSILGETLEKLAQKANYRKPKSIKVLCSSLDSPYHTNLDYLSLHYNKRSADSDATWSKESYIKSTIEKFRGRTQIRLSYEPLYGKLLGDALHSRIGDGLEIKAHSEPYLWEMIILDNVMYIQGDTYKNSGLIEPVLVLRKNNDPSLDISKNYFFIIEKYFDDIWFHKSTTV